MARILLGLMLLGLCAPLTGCAMSRPPMVAGNPVFVSNPNEEQVWERTIDVVHDYFELARENRTVGTQPGVIETRYKVGSGLLEPWNSDSHGFQNRAESTLQSIRRRAIINVMPAQGGYFIAVEVQKEIEDQPGIVNNTPGGATFHQGAPLRRDLDQVTGQSAPSGWVARGRDVVLESEILRRLQSACTQ